MKKLILLLVLLCSSPAYSRNNIKAIVGTLFDQEMGESHGFVLGADYSHYFVKAVSLNAGLIYYRNSLGDYSYNLLTADFGPYLHLWLSRSVDINLGVRFGMSHVWVDFAGVEASDNEFQMALALGFGFWVQKVNFGFEIRLPDEKLNGWFFLFNVGFPI